MTQPTLPPDEPSSFDTAEAESLTNTEREPAAFREAEHYEDKITDATQDEERKVPGRD